MSDKKTGRRRILREFTITEISAVDRPAQEAAKMVLMKRGEPDGLDKDESSFQTRVSEVAKRHGCSRMAAMRKARVEYPDEFEEYQAEGAVSSRLVVKREALPGAAKAKREFDRAVSELVSSAGISRTAARSRVRRERPDLYEALQMTGAT